MKIFFAVFVPLFFLNRVALYSQTRYRTRYDVALTAEVGGMSPFVSANFEFVPFKTKTSFGVIRAGAGFISNGSQGVSVPVALLYNFILKGKENCDAAPKRSFRETFLEVGVGSTYVSFLGQKAKYYFAPTVGFRKQFIRWGDSNVFFYKAHLTPIYADQRFRFGADISIGHSL